MTDIKDQQYKQLLNWIQCAFGDEVVQTNSSALQSSNAVESFINSGNCMLLEVYQDTDGKLHTLNSISFPGSAVQEIHFIKSKPEPYSDTNPIKIGSMLVDHSSPSDNLLTSIKHVYGPLLQRYSQNQPTPLLQNLLTELESGLQTLVARERATQMNTADASDIYFLTPQDEFRYWYALSETKNDKLYKLAKSITEIVRPKFLDDEYEVLDQKKLEDVLDGGDQSLIDKTVEVLETIWLDVESYSQKRMTHLLSTIASALGRFIQLKCTELDLWNERYSTVKISLERSLEICYEWTRAITKLTRDEWPNHDSRPWKGGDHCDEFMSQLIHRLDEILRIRTSCEQVLQTIMSQQQQQSAENNSEYNEGSNNQLIQELFTPFASVQAVHITPHTDKLWRNAVMQFEKNMLPLERRITEKLQSKLASLSGRPMLLVHMFQQNKELIQRPNIFKHLNQERMVLLGQLKTQLNIFQNEYHDLTAERVKVEGGSMSGRAITGFMNSLICAKQIQDRIEKMLWTAHTFLNDLNDYDLVVKEVEHFYKELDEFCTNEFNHWMEEISRMGSLQLENTSMISLDKNKRMVVNYNERLVSVLQEVPHLSALGFDVPGKIISMAKMAEEFYAQAITLKQIANFYNNAHTQVIRSQSAMLVDAASNFERVILDFDKQKKVWSRLNGERYIAQLKEASETVTSENRKLRKYHLMVHDKVVQLFSISLLSDKELWLDKVKEIEKLFKYLETHYKRTEGWIDHWNVQVYKALEHQYRMGLETLNENLQEIRVDLIFKEKRIQFSPSFEKIREGYYDKIKDFIAFPEKFAGIGKNQQALYKQMIYRNYEGLKVVYSKANALFTRLLRVKKKFSEHVQLGMLVGDSTEEMEQLVRESVLEIVQWEANFRMLKDKGKEVERIENAIKVDCITVSTLQIKATLDDQLQKLGQILVKVLREQTQAHISKISQFIIGSLELLHNDPQTMDEIGQSHAHCVRLAQEKKVIFLEFDKFDRLNRTLRSVAGITLDSSAVKEQWNDFGDTLTAHEIYLKDRTSALRKDTEIKLHTFNNDLIKFAARWHEFKPKNANFISKEQSKRDIKFIQDKKEEFLDVQKRSEDVIRECEYFGVSPVITTERSNVPISVRSFLDDLSSDIISHEDMWKVYEEFLETVEDLEGKDWLTFKKVAYNEFDDFVTEWNVKLKSIETKNSITAHIREELDILTEFRDVIKYLQGDGWTPEHWASLFRICGIKNSMTLETLQFGILLEKSAIIVQQLAAIKELNERALGEDQLRKALQEIKIWASGTEFSLYEYTTTVSSHSNQLPKKVCLIKEWKDVLTEVGDNQSLLQSLKDSKYITEFAVEVGTWEEQMFTLDHYLLCLNQIQRKWIYLEPIFQRGSLPSHQQIFNRVDKEFQGIMVDIEADKRVIQLAKRNLADVLKKLLDQLEICQKALNAFLEEKRSVFPRFYFIGDDDLLEILGQSQNPEIIQTHLKKLFAGIRSVMFNDSNTQIISMNSAEGEQVLLKNAVSVTEKVEEWLHELDLEMRYTLQQLLIECDNSSVFSLDAFPSQILCLSAAITFTRKCEYAITHKSLDSLHSELKQQLNEYTSIDTKDDTVLDLKIKSLILDLIHNVEVVEQLQDHSITGNVSIEDWIWQKQLRFYLQDVPAQSQSKRTVSSICIIRMCNAQFDYTYEYQGNVQKLVHTPLTDKCYLTLTQGMHLGYGGNPYGPAGTGKTESVKALGHLFARQVLVFNCDEGIDFKSMGRIFIGLVKCGAWGCFDEFNRLKEDQLSAISQQIQVIQAAIKDKRETPIDLLGKQVVVNLNAGIFVTLNPAGKGYGGRSKLPDNLKQLFRSVAMAAPDNDLIAEVILYSEGFQHAKELGRKLVSIFTLSKQLLSPQQHYDWGLRALKAVLRVGGSQIQLSKKQGIRLTKELESQIVIKALRVNTLSKLTYDDSKLFDGIVRDVFPGIDAPDISYVDMDKAIKEVLAEMNLLCIESQMKKMLQFYEAVRGRIGVVLVGPSGSGKSTVWKVLHAAIQKLGRSVKSYVLNPKAMSRQQLLGNMDIDTREWSDGIITANARKMVKEPLEALSWIVCDGDIDPEWVESLNSVLDDNHLLTMPNGERIQFGANVNFIFETHSLQYASPATVSRMGMIFLSEEDVDTKSLVTAWINKHSSGDLKNTISRFIDMHFYRALDVLFKPVYRKEFVVETTIMGVVLNALSHLCTNTDTVHHSDYSKSEFTCGLLRGLGSILPLKHRIEFAREILELCGEEPVDPRRPLDCFYSRESGSFIPYSLDDLHDGSCLVFEELHRYPMIHTLDVQRASDVINPWLATMEPFIVVGPEGCGKSMLLYNLFDNLKNTYVATLHCNSQTSAVHVIQKLNQSCSIFTTNSGKVLRPKERERLILYLKDLNLPKPDMYGTTQLISFLQQLLTYNGYYDSDLEWIGLEKIQIIASMNPSSSVGRYDISTRLTSIVRVVSLSYPERDQLQIIFNEILKTTLSRDYGDHSIWKLPQNVALMTQAMVDFYDRLVSKFSVDEYAHYQFTPRDLTKWILGLLNYTSPVNDTSPNELIDILLYEARRLFRDRLVTGAGQYDAMENGMIRHFEQLGYVPNPKAEPVLFSSLTGINASTAGTLLKARPEATNDSLSLALNNRKQLISIPIKKFATIIQIGLRSYARDNRTLRIFLISEYAEFIARVDRVLSQPGGSLLLVGRPGIGRKNAVVLVSHLLNYDVFMPSMSLGYSIKNFRADLKQVLQTTGIQDKPTVLLLEDHNIADESFLEYINSLLSSGEIPGIFSPEELDQMLPQLREQASKEAALYETPYNLLIARIRRNLRVVLIMDPTGPTFSVRCQSNPAIFTQCTIQWMESFSRNGYARIPNFLIADIMKSMSDVEQKELVKHMLMIHDSVAKNGNATPLDFVRFVESFKYVFNNKKDSKSEQLQHLQKGLSKLEEASHSVDVLSKEAVKQKKLLAQKQVQKEEALKQIQHSMELSVKETTSIQKIQEKISTEEAKLSEKRQIIQSKLATVQPILESAQTAVGKLKPDNLNEIKVLSMPPPGIRDILEGVVKLMGQPDTSWKGIKQFLGSRGVISQILTFDARNASEKDIQDVADYIKKTTSFQEENARRSSVAAAPLAKWVLANVEYAQVLKQVGPLEAELNELNNSQEQYKLQLQQCESKLAKLNERIKELQDEFQQKTDEAAAIKFGVEKAEKTLGAAQSLLNKLSGEKDRWSKQNDQETKLIKSLPKLVLLAAAFISYLPHTAEDVRKSYLRQWLSFVKLSDDDQYFDIKGFMSTESELLKYKAEGLPGDDLSMENAIAILNSVQYPLIIDPSQQATEWLQTNMMEKSIETTNPQDPKFSNTLELAVRFGKILLIKEVDSIDPVLYPLLRQEITVSGTRKSVKIGDKTIDFNDEFKLFLVTRNPNIQLPPDAEPLLTRVNFTVTRSGLEGQLLGLTIQHENPELETKKSELLKKEEDNKIQLADLERQLLNELANSKGDILENVTLINKLTEIKKRSQIIMESLIDSGKLREELDRKRETYRPFALNGSRIYFLIGDLKRINSMYQFSLSNFISLFKQALEAKSDRAANLNARIALLTEELQRIVFDYISRSLFKEDRLLFAVHLVHGLFPELFDNEEWNFFIGTIVKQSGTSASAITVPKWITADRKALYMSFVSQLPDLAQQLDIASDSSWENWAQSPDCFTNFPSHKKASPFQQLLLIKLFVPEQLHTAMTSFVCRVLGILTVSPPSMKLELIYKELSTKSEPVLLITTPGADPSQELEEMANRTVGSDSFHQIAMGGGQITHALQSLRRCVSKGQWLCLKNLHLVVSWLPVLEKELALLLPSAHDNFRLWLTTEGHDSFPVILLQHSLKITFESPPGLKQNMLRTFDSWDENFLSHQSPSNTNNPKMRARILFILAWFHAVLQERRSYIPQGWSKFYEFSSADLRSASDVIEAASTGRTSPDWPTIHGLLENAIYGGRVDNDFDVRVLRSYLALYFNDTMVSSNTSELAKGFTIPTTTSHLEYVRKIQSIGDGDKPAQFGLPPNADKLVQISRASRVIDSLKSLVTVHDVGGKFNKEQWSNTLNPILTYWNKLVDANKAQLTGEDSQVVHETATHKKELGSKNINPIHAFISLEFRNAKLLITYVDSRLKAIEDVVRGTALVTSTIQSDAVALVAGCIPDNWQNKWEHGPATQVQTWLHEIVSKTLALSKWYEKSVAQTLLSEEIDLRNLFNPNIFLNALKQHTARKTNQPLDALVHLIAIFKSSKAGSDKCSIQVKSLLLQGATFDGATLSDLKEDNAPALSEFPQCEISWITDSDLLAMQAQAATFSMPIPVYFSPTREKLLARLIIPCGYSKDDEKRFILAGTALFVESFM